MKKRRRPAAGRLIIIGLLFILTLYGFFVGPLRALTNDILLAGVLNLAVAFGIMAAFFYLVLWLAGSHVLPVNSHDRHEKVAARDLLRRFATGGYVAMAVVRDGAVEPGPNGESRERVAGHGVIDVDSTDVVTLHTSIAPSRIKGTGLIFTRESEHLSNIVDLRIQMRSQEFEFLTRDGIPVKARLSLRFQIDQANFNKNLHAHDPRVPFPAPISWSMRPVARALANLQVVDGGGPLTKWSDLPLLYANGMLRPVISEYRFDDLLLPAEPARDPRKEIREQISARLKPVLMQQGVKVLGFGIGLFLPQGFDADKAFDPEKPQLDEVTAQRIKAWKAEWESRMIKLNAEAQAEADRQREKAKAQARLESMLRLIQALEQDLPPGSDQDQVAQHFWKVVKNITDDPGTRALLEEEQVRFVLQLARPGELPPQTDQPESHGFSSAS
jgi:regulator of protease activity HflC (stomatin/prohibitin superfamily)